MRNHRDAILGSDRCSPFGDPAVAAVFDRFPASVAQQLRKLRELILHTAADLEGVSGICETLKWGGPAYLTTNRSGTTIRLGTTQTDVVRSVVLFNCRTTLVETFRSMFPASFDYVGSRQLTIVDPAEIPTEQLAACLEMALTYHQRHARSGGGDSAVRRAHSGPT